MTVLKRLIARFIVVCPCPNCGHTIKFSGGNGSTYCSGCKKRIDFRDSKPVGWH